jgi:hypothetical protein
MYCYVCSEFGKFAYTAIVMLKCTLWSDNTCVFTSFHSVKNTNTQLIWSSVYETCFGSFIDTCIFNNIQQAGIHGETRLKLSYSKPVYMARLVQEANKHGETCLELSCRNPVRPNKLSLVCLYLSLYISFLLFALFFLFDTQRQKALLYKSNRKHTICMRWKFWDFLSFV